MTVPGPPVATPDTAVPGAGATHRPSPPVPQRGGGGEGASLGIRFVRLGFYAVLFALWWALAARQVWPPYLLPPPAEVWVFLKGATEDGTLLPAMATSAARVGLGYTLSLLIGTALGLALARVKWLDETLGSAVVGLQSLPSICWFPLALLWFGLNEKAVLFVVVMGAAFAVTLAVRAGVRNLPPLTLRAARAFGATGLRLLWHVLLPATSPAFLGGMRQGWAFAWRSLMAAELVSQSLKTGVGHLLSTGRDLNDMAMVLGMIGTILAFGLLVDRLLFYPVERSISHRWGVEGA